MRHTLRCRWPTVVALAGLAIFLFVSLRHLDSVPQVYEDEPWQASTAYKLATRGVFGSDLFAGFMHMDERYYGFMPLHPFLLAAIFKFAGTDRMLGEARLETVALTAATLILTYALGSRLFSKPVGGVAVLVLVLVRWTGLTYIQLTGIPLVDFARIARYDPLVPVLGLASLHVYISARNRQSLPLYAASGILASASGLAHVYGLFWIPALVMLTILDRPASLARCVALFAVGALLPWLPYAAYVLNDLPDWRGQIAVYASRFELLNPHWYVNNILEEFHRYGPGLGPFGPAWLLRPGVWFLAVALPLSLFALARRALAGDVSARTLVVPSLTFPVLFALLITLKLVNYTLIELPLFALAVAWGSVSLWQRPLPGVGLAAPRLLLIALGAGIAIEGAFALARIDSATATPYPVFASEVRQLIPPGARVLGLHTYWIGLEDFDYRSFLVPLNEADLGVPLDQALDAVDPDVVLLDPRMRTYFESLPPGGDAERFETWLARHSAREIGRIDDPTYGQMIVYLLKR